MDSRSRAIDQRLVKALSHPLRVEILTLLSNRGALSPKGLSEIMDESLNLVSYHVTRVLFDECGILKLKSTRQRRGATEHFYVIKPGVFFGDLEFQRQVPEFLRGNLLGASLAGFIDQATLALESGEINSGDATLINWMNITVDSEGEQQLRELLESSLETANSIEEECAERIAADPAAATQRRIFNVSSFQAVDPNAPVEEAADSADEAAASADD